MLKTTLNLKHVFYEGKIQNTMVEKFVNLWKYNKNSTHQLSTCYMYSQLQFCYTITLVSSVLLRHKNADVIFLLKSTLT